MSVNTPDVPKVIYDGDGATSIFPFDFNIYLTSDLVVSVKNDTTSELAGLDPGEIVTLSEGTDYSVSLNGAAPNNGDVTILDADFINLPVGLQLIIQRVLPETQLISFKDNETTPAATYQEAFDRAVMLIQQLQEVLNRLVIRDISATESLTLPSLEAGKVLGNDGSSLLWQALEITSTDYPANISFGVDASKAASPGVGDVYFSTDTKKIYFCASAGVWTSMPQVVLGSVLDDLDTISSGAGIIPPANLGSGTPSASNFLRGDGSWAAAGNAVSGSFKNLKSIYATAATLTVTADELIVCDSSGNSFKISSYNKTANITISGAGGLDTGAEASNTWYYVWAIRKSSDGTTNILLSTSASSPTMPSGYDQKALVSAVRNDGSSNFVSFIQWGNQYRYSSWQSMASGNVGAAAWVTIDTTSFVASGLSDHCFGGLAVLNAAQAAIGNDNTIAVGNTPDRNKIMVEQGAIGQVLAWQMSTITANTLYWYSNDADGVVHLHGFIINKLAG